jgi:hypothetical protein
VPSIGKELAGFEFMIPVAEFSLTFSIFPAGWDLELVNKLAWPATEDEVAQLLSAPAFKPELESC